MLSHFRAWCFGALAAFSMLFAASFFTACDGKNENIRAQTNGVLEYQQDLFVEFSDEFVRKNPLNEQALASQGLIEDGKLKAKLNGKDTQIVVRELRENAIYLNLLLKANESYRVEFKIYDTKVKLNFKTAPLKINIKDAIFQDEFDKSVLAVRFDSSFELDESGEGIELKKDGKPLKFTLLWENSTNTLRSEEFALTDKNQKLNLAFKKRKLGLGENLEFNYISNAKGELSLQAAKSDGKDIELEFSAELEGKQNLKDFIQISPQIDFNAVLNGNKVRLMGAFSVGQNYEIKIMQGLATKGGTKSAKEFSVSVNFSDLEPSLAFSSDGVFLPSGAERKIAFKSLNVKKIKLKIHQIYANNLAEYLRYRNFQAKKQISSSQSEIAGWDGEALEYTADLILEREFELESKKNQWVQNEIKLDALKDLSGVFVVSLSYDEKGADYDFSELEGYQRYDFFRRRAEVSKHLVFSNLAMSAQSINGEIFVNVRDFTTMNAASGVKVEAISKKNQVIAAATTDSSGDALLNASDEKVLFLLAHKDEQASILKLNQTLSTDGFDVGGAVNLGKIRAFIYAERGVHRPGDSVHLNVVAKNEKGAINHPIHLSVKDPRNRTLGGFDKMKLEPINDGMFYAKIELEKTAETGIYEASFDIAGEKFTHKLLVQNVVANRINVALETAEFIDLNKAKNLDFKIAANYLFGAPASGLKTRTLLNIKKKPFKNELYPKFIFENPSLYVVDAYDDRDGTLDEKGVLSEKFELRSSILESIGVNFEAKINAEVFEQGGRSVKNVASVELRKHDFFIGIKELENHYLNAGESVNFEVIVSDLQNKLLKGKKLEYKVYQSRSSWWWDYNSHSDFLRSIKRDKNSQIIAQGELMSDSKPVNLSFESKQHFGDMFIEITEAQSGVSVGQSFYISSWGEPSAADVQSALKIKSDKKSYKIGETAKVEFESTKNSRALVTLSNNEGVIKRFVLEGKEGATSFEVPIERAFAPNIYASVSLLQEYESWQNDRALRLFGVLPLRVEDTESKLVLSVKAPEKILPQSEFEVEIQSADKKPYTYTLAVVDEGLLSLTNFKTPDIWGYFYAKTGFKLKVFDTYDKIIAKTYGAVAKVLATGGGEMLAASAMNRAKKSKEDEQAERFKPVVLYQAPAKSDNKGFARVKFTMPSYMGSVRVMAVATNERAHGAADKAVLVSAPAIMLETLPRALRVGDEFKLLVQVFKIDKDVKKASLRVSAKNNLASVAQTSKSVDFSSGDTQNLYFDVKVNNDKMGVEDFEFELNAGKYSFKSQAQIDIKAKNTYTFASESFVVKAGESKEFSVDDSFLKGSTTAVLKLSPTPILNLDKRLNFLLRYPYGCIEQTTSAVLPQLYLDKFSFKADKQKIINNINAAIARFSGFQTADGGFAYWQGGRDSDAWGSNYAGLFLLAAKDAGYFVPQNLLNRWINYEQNFIKQNTLNHASSLIYQANSLFLLALAKQPNISAMNVLYERHKEKLDTASLWQLAAAYKLAGMDDIALKIAQNAPTKANLSKNLYSYTYGSALRDSAIIANAYKIVYGKSHDGLLKEITAALEANDYLSTQSAGYALYALALGLDLADKKQGENMDASVNLNGKNTKFTQNALQSLEFANGKAVVSAKKDVFVNFGVEGIKRELSTPYSRNLSIKREFLDEKGQPLEVGELKSSKAFYMKLSVGFASESFSRVENLALTQILPSGWEVSNMLLDYDTPRFARSSSYDFIDTRDDKIMWFFDLNRGENKQFYVKLNAVTPGKYTLSGAFVEAMYDDNFQALSEGKSVIVGQ